jgi:diguanylate cyclase (GGDEF)-like protein/PAS domain S-box-containing protein
MSATGKPEGQVAPPIPENEAERLAALHSLALLDTPAEAGFDAITRLAAQICGVPIALISLVDRDRQWFKSSVGLPGITQTPRESSFCAHAVADRQPLEVPDTHKDARFRANPLVTGEPRMRFYAGFPIADGKGHLLGTLCVIDREPRRLDDSQRAMLRHLADAVEAMLEWRKRGVAAGARLGALLDSDASEIFMIDPVSLRCTYANRGALDNTGFTAAELQKTKISELFPSVDPDAFDRDLRALARGLRKSVELETVCRRKDGSTYVGRGMFHHHGEGDPPVITAIFEDITQHKRVEAELQTYVAGLTAIINIQRDLATGVSDPDRLMRLILVRAKEIVGAKGAVIEVIEGGQLVHRAATDEAPSEIGSRRKTEGNFSALALREARAVRCDEAQADPRVDREACARLGIRSMVAAPFYRERRAAGVLKVFSGLPHAFTDQTAQLVQLLASTLGSAMQRQAEERAFLEIARGVTIETGTGFFRTLAGELARLLEAQHVLIGELTESRESIRVVALNERGQIAEGSRYPVAGTLVERMLKGEMFYQARAVKAAFAGDRLLAAIDADACLGMPLLASDRSVIGVIVALFSGELESAERTGSMLEIFAARASSELERQRADHRLREQTQLMQSVLDSIADGVTVADADGTVVMRNPAARRMLGVPAPDNMALERLSDHYGLFRADGVTPFPTDELPIVQAVRGQSTDAIELVVRNAGFPGGQVVNAHGRPLLGADGSVRGGVVVFRDITQLKRSEEQVRNMNLELEARVAMRTAEVEAANRELEARYHENELLNELSKLLQSCVNVAEGVQVIANYGPQLFPDSAGLLYLANPERKSFDSAASWGSPANSEEVLAADDCWALRRGQLHVCDAQGASLVCRHVTLPAGQGAACQCVPLLSQGETVGLLYLENAGAAALISDSARRLATTLAEQLALALGNIQLRERLRNQSIRDPLTGLFNRRFLEESLGRELARAERKETPLALLVVDADHFKRYNDQFGHDAGDHVLQQLGWLLGEFIRESDIACRYGGEEFVLLLPGASEADAATRAQMLLSEVRGMNLEFQGQWLGRLTVSIGLAVFPDHGRDPDALFQMADAALYRSKAEGRNRLTIAGDKQPAARKPAAKKTTARKRAPQP